MPSLMPLLAFLLQISLHTLTTAQSSTTSTSLGRSTTSLDTGWRFWRSETNPDGVIYDHRPDLSGINGTALKPWILPSANDFIQDPAKHHLRPDRNPPNIRFAQESVDDSTCQSVIFPHDWTIAGPFYTGPNPVIGGGMGRLPVHGVGWYRKKFADEGRSEGERVYLDIDGAMSYAIVWLNGHLVGGWPYGYNLFRLDLTPYILEQNQIAIRLDNPRDSARWYPGGGIYRNM